jgi:hypothetical protein
VERLVGMVKPPNHAHHCTPVLFEASRLLKTKTRPGLTLTFKAVVNESKKTPIHVASVKMLKADQKNEIPETDCE